MSRAALAVLAVEPWLGGSHARFLETWRARSAHDVAVIGLPARHWKWRMQGGAFALARRAARAGRACPDVVLASDYLDLARFRGYLPPAWAGVPAVLYLHESQLTYPGGPGADDVARDETYGFANVLSCLAADAVVFNSAYHRETFAAAARELVRRLPRPRPAAALDAALDAARVIGPGVELEALPLGPGAPSGAPLRVAFNHRWEHDKDPVAFLSAAAAVRGVGGALEVVLLGQGFGEEPEEVAPLAGALGDAVLHRGYAADRSEYARLLGGCDLAVSTARHELFGIALLEAVAAGCTPLAPRALSYPEVLPESLHGAALYEDAADLARRLARAARDPRPLRDPARRARMREAAAPHDARRTARELDALCDELAARGRAAR